MKDLKKYIDYLKDTGVSETSALDLLKGCKDLNSEEKNIIYLYCYPRNLGDRELPKRYSSFLSNHPDLMPLVPSNLKAALLIEAFKTEQYGMFMKHLFIAFGNPENILPISGSELVECPICGKRIAEMDKWREVESQDPQQNFLAFGSKESSQVLCKDCILHLAIASNILSTIEPDYLRKWNRKIEYINRMRENAYKG